MSEHSRLGISECLVASSCGARESGRRPNPVRLRLLPAFLVAAITGLLLLAAMPGLAGAQDNLTDQKKDKTTLIGKTLDFGVVPQSSLPAVYQIYIRTNNSSGGCNAAGGSCDRREVDVNVRLNDPAYERGGGNCDTRTPDPGWTFQARLSYRSNNGGNCSIDLHLKAGTPPGNYDTTLDFASAFGGWNGSNQPGSATILGTITPESGNVIRAYDQDGAELSSVDFGEVAVDDAVTRTITLVNRGTTVMTGADRALSGSGAYSIESTTCGAALGLNSSCDVTVRYAPTMSSDADQAELAFTSASGHSSSVQFTGSGIGPTAGISVTPDSADFGTSPAGIPVHRSFLVQNTGNTNLDLGIAADPGPYAGQVEFSDGTTPCGATLAVAASCEVRVGFAPAESGDSHQQASFTVTGSSALVSEPAGSTVELAIERVAPVAAIEVRDAAGETPVSEFSFGDVPVGTTAEQTFQIVNAGNVSVPSLTPSFAGPWAADFEVIDSTCGEIPRDGSCSITIRYRASSGAAASGSLLLAPGEAPVRAEPVAVALSAQGSGVRILNDDLLNLSGVNQKVWLDTLTSGAAASPGDRIRVAFELQKGSAETVEDLLVSTTLPKTDTVPEPDSFVPIPNGLGKVEIREQPGSATAFVIGEFPAVAIYGANVKTYGLDDDSGTRTYLGQKVPYTCGGDPTTGIGDGNGGKSKTDDRRIWLRVRTASGSLSQIVGSIVRFSDARIPRACGGGALFYDQQVTEVGGQEQAPGALNAVADKGESVSFSFRTNASRKAAQGNSEANVNGINWRIRNSRTGAMFVRTGDGWTACAAPCVADENYSVANGSKIDFADVSPDLVRTLALPYGLPSRGRWIVESNVWGTENDRAQFQEIGSVLVNSSGPSPTVTLSGTPPNRPASGSEWTIQANVDDPLDTVGDFDAVGGRPQVIEWDLNNDPADGPAGDGFETRYEASPSDPLPAAYLSQPFTTAGKDPGPYTIRARVTDNGALDAADGASRSEVASASFTINAPPAARSETVELEADDGQPATVAFRADDPDEDSYSVEVTPAAGNSGDLAGSGNSREYSWPATFTGSDRFEYVATDDLGGTGAAGQLTVRVHPDTTLDQAEIPAQLHNPRPGEGYLGATAATTAEFDFSSPQSPVAAYQCRHLLDGDPVSDWSECAEGSTGSEQLENLEDGLHRLEVRAVNADGMVDGSPVHREWRVDTAAPETAVLSGPVSGLPDQQPRPTSDSTPAYRFHATAAERSPQQTMSYECRALWGPENGTWVPCGTPADSDGSGPIELTGPDSGFGITDPLPEGTYEFEVRATDEVGNQGPASHESFTVDLTPPVTSVSNGPDGLIATRDVTYDVTSTEPNSTFRCELVGESQGVVFAAAECPGGGKPAFTGLADDVYHLTVTALDPGTNPDPDPPTVGFEIDATAPVTSGPAVDFGNGETENRITGSRRITVAFDGSDNRRMDGFECRLDSAEDEDWIVCSPPETFGGLVDGEHRLEIRARDEAGNADGNPVIVEWTIDNEPPLTVIEAGPAPFTSELDPPVEFTSSSDAVESFCRLDGGEWQSCASPVSPAALAEGALADGIHRLAIRSVDRAGNEEGTSALAAWIQDTVDPVVELTAFPAGDVPAGDADFGWTVRDGDPLAIAPEVGTECSLDGAEWEPCERSFTVESPEPGSHLFAVRASDAAGNRSEVVSQIWNVVGEPLAAPSIDAADPPAEARTRMATATFEFSHADEGDGWSGHFECRLDQTAWAPCTSPHTESGLGDGSHAFRVRVADEVGNVSPAVTSVWEVDTAAPATSIDGGPSGIGRQRGATILFSADRAATFECRVDGGEWEACTSPLVLDGLADGDHSVAVRATSTVSPDGVTDPSPAERSWSVDASPPGTSLTAAPIGKTEKRDARITFESDEPGAGFHCSLDGAPFNVCESPLELENLAYGEHTLTVRAVDSAGNVDPDPVSTSWMVLTPPQKCPEGQRGTPPNCVEPPDDETCPAGQLGTPPDCQTPGEVDLVTTVKLSKHKVRSGGKVAVKVRLINRGGADSGALELCLKTPRRLIRGKGRRCRSVSSVAAGETVAFRFKLRAKKVRRKQKAVLKLNVPSVDGAGQRVVKRKLTVKGKGGKS